MIDVSRIYDLAELEDIKNSLNFFINKKIVVEVYEDDGKTRDELDADRELARELLGKVLAQIDKAKSRPRRYASVKAKGPASAPRES